MTDELNQNHEAVQPELENPELEQTVPEAPEEEPAPSANTEAEAPEKLPVKKPIAWDVVGKNIQMVVFPMVFLIAAFTVVYYILFPAKGEFHSDCTDTIYWAKATFDSGKIFNPDFDYACLLPFGGNLLMLIFMPFFGLSMTTHTLGMLLFFVLFLVFFCLLLREMKWDYRWICSAGAILLAVLCSSQKMREIFWGHTIYYSLGVLFLSVGFFLLFRLGNLLEKRKHTVQAGTLQGKRNFHGIVVTIVVLGIFFLLTGTDEITSITIFALPTIAALLLERLLDRQTKLFSRKNGMTALLAVALLLAVVVGMQLASIWAGDIVASYQEAFSGYAEQSDWLENAQKFPLAWMTLLGLEDIPNESLMSGKSILNLIRMATAGLLLVLPILATCCYPKYTGKSGRQIRLLILAHWVMTALIMVGYICGLLSAGNWRLCPIVCTSLLVSLVFIHWAITSRTSMSRIAGIFLIPLVCFGLTSIGAVMKLPYNLVEDNTEYQLVQLLEEEGLDYGYATFWNANAMTVLSNSKVEVRTIDADENGIYPHYYQTERSWYTAQENEDDYFVLLSQSEYDTAATAASDLFSRADRTMQIQDSNGSNYYVLTFAENIF